MNLFFELQFVLDLNIIIKIENEGILPDRTITDHPSSFRHLIIFQLQRRAPEISLTAHLRVQSEEPIIKEQANQSRKA